MYLGRDVCQVLEDMEKCLETRNFSTLQGLINEARIMSSRAENILEDNYEYRLRRMIENEKKYLKLKEKLDGVKLELAKRGVDYNEQEG